MNEKQKVVLVTGSSRGIGRGIAMEMARQGYAVVVHGSTDSPALGSAYEEVKRLSPASICAVAQLSQERGDPRDVRGHPRHVRPDRRPGQ